MRKVWPVISLKQARLPAFLTAFVETAIGWKHLKAD